MYNYYLWGYDDSYQRILATKYAVVGYHMAGQHTQFYEVGPDGMPLDRPLLMGNQVWFSANYNPELFHHGYHFK